MTKILPLSQGPQPEARPLTGTISLSVVVPVYGCADCLRTLYQRLTRVLTELDIGYEIILVDDSSRDGAWAVMRELSKQDAALRCYRLSRNFGQHAAITAGLSKCRAEHAIVMDCDLQDPPEHIRSLYAKALDGFDVVLSRRHQRRQAVARRMTGALYYHVRNRLLGTDMHTNYTNFSIISRKVIDAFLRLNDRDRQYLLIIDWLGFHRAVIDVHASKRYVGRSSYTLPELVRVSVDGLFFQSTVLLRWIVYLGFSLAGVGGAAAAYLFAARLGGEAYPGWTSIVVIMLVTAGFIVISTGVSALYVGKIFEQVKGRPLFVIDTELVGGVEPAQEPETTPLELVDARPDGDRAALDATSRAR